NGSAPTANQVQTSLLTIPELLAAGAANVQVSVSGTTYTVTLGNVFSQPKLGATTPPASSLNVAVNVQGQSDGQPASPSAADTEANLATIPGLAGNVKVLGPNGGPFRILFTNGLAGELAPVMTTSVSGGATAAVANDVFAQVSNNEVQRLSFSTNNGQPVIVAGTATFTVSLPIGASGVNITTPSINYTNDPVVLAG